MGDPIVNAALEVERKAAQRGEVLLSTDADS
jgi:hypothetical protein